MNSRLHLVIGLVIVAAIISACAMQDPGGIRETVADTTLLYTGDAGKNTENMTPFKKKYDTGIFSPTAEFMIPAGYEITGPEDDSGEVKVIMEKKEGASTIMVSIIDTMRNETLARRMRELLNESLPNNQKAAPMRKVETPGHEFYPVFEVYLATAVTQGLKVPMVGYVGWRHGLDGPNYGVFGVTSADENTAFENDFISVLRTLR